MPGGRALGLSLGWWLCSPLCLFVFSLVTRHSVFVSRYLSAAIPGAALVATLAVAVFLPARYWKQLALTLGIGVLIFAGGWSHLWPSHHNSDWRGSAHSFNEQNFGLSMPVICPSPFIEAKPPVWRPGYPLSSFLYSHLLVYPLQARLYPSPFESSPETENYAATLLAGTLLPARRFAV